MFRAVIGVFGLDPKTIFDSISPYGEVVTWLFIFAETGLLVGFFLPGDSLLFTAGVLAGQGRLELWLLLPGVFVAAFLGSELGYYIGYRWGRRCSVAPIRACSSRSMWSEPTSSSTGTGPRRSCWPGSSRSCARSRR